MALYTSLTAFHLYFYFGSPERMAEMAKTELALLEFTPPELTKEEYEAIQGFYMERMPR